MSVICRKLVNEGPPSKILKILSLIVYECPTWCPTTNAHTLIDLCDGTIINTAKKYLEFIVPTSGHFIQKKLWTPERTT